MRLNSAGAVAVAATSLFDIVMAKPSPLPHSAVCCKALYTSKLKEKVYFPNSTLYEDRLDSYWSVSAALEPWCMVQPSTAKDVSLTIKTLVANNCTFGVRGGGHGFFAGSNSVSDGVTIDFGNMNATSYNTQTKIATIQPGGHWQDVYDTLAPYGVTVTGGRAGTVGVGGFITGGGNSFHSASHGMACDTVANWEVVLADGSIVNANATHNSDLWVALKGGSANFGLITKFDMYAIEFPDPTRPEIWGGNYIYNLSSGPAVIDAFVDFTENVYKDENSSSIVYWAFIPAIGGMLLNAAVENTLGTVAPSAFDGYRAVPGLTADTTKVAPMSNVTRELGSGQPAGFRNAWFTLSFDNDARIMNYAVEKYYELSDNMTATLDPNSGFNTLCMFQPITKSIAEKGVKNGGNIMGLDYYTQNGNGVMFLATLAINGADQEAIGSAMLKDYVDQVEAYAKSVGGAWDWKYLNYADKSQDPIATFGSAALQKMRAASFKYDPTGVFQTLRGSGFKIPV